MCEKLKLPTEEAIDFLRNDQSECGKLYRQFISKHGHRGSNELLTNGIPYIRNHKELISAIMVGFI